MDNIGLSRRHERDGIGRDESEVGWGVPSFDHLRREDVCRPSAARSVPIIRSEDVGFEGNFSFDEQGKLHLRRGYDTAPDYEYVRVPGNDGT
jgi:hypothetical protein